MNIGSMFAIGGQPGWLVYGGSLPTPFDSATQLYVASNYVTSPSPAIKNSALISTSLGPNLFRGSRRVFSNSGLWAASGTTATDNVSTAPDGTTSASRLVITANAGAPSVRNYLSAQTVGATFPSGTYTIAVYAKSNTGGNQTFALAIGYAGSTPDKTATTSWQRFTYTVTFATSVLTPNIGILNDSVGSAADLLICDLELFSGSSDLGPIITDGNLYLGSTAYGTSLPSLSANVLNMNNAYGVFQVPYYTPTNITAQAVVKLNASASSYRAFISNIKNYLTFTAYVDNSLQMESIASTIFGNTVPSNTSTTNAPGLWNLFDGNWHVLTSSYNASGSISTYYLDDVFLGYIGGAASTFTNLGDFWANNLITGGYTANYQLLGMSLWNSALTKTQINQSITYWSSVASNAGVTLSGLTGNRIYCSEGDSITGSFTYSYPYTVGSNASPAVLGSNWAVGGSGLSDLVNIRASTVDTVIPTSINGRKFILSVLIGANDANSATYNTSITNIIGNGTTATVTLSSSITPLTAGTFVSITGNSESTFNGTFTILASPAPTGTTFAFTRATVTTGTGGNNCTYGQNLANYCASRKAAGWKMIVATILPKSLSPAISSFSNVGGLLTINGSGFSTTANLPVTFLQTSGTLPTGLTSGSTYYIVAGGSSSTMTVSAISGGAAVVYVDSGSAVSPTANFAYESFNAIRNGINASITAKFPGVYSNAIADFAANGTMGIDSSFAFTPNNWNDGTHPSSAGQGILAGIMTTAVNSL